MPEIQVNGVKLYYELTGRHGDPIVLIHGSWGDHSNWDAVVPGFSDNFRVLTYDRRGHSRSEKPATQGSGDEDASDISALITELDLAPAHVVGNSFGASIALKLAIKQPTIFRSLSIHEPPLFDLLSDEPSAKQGLQEMQVRINAVKTVLERGDSRGGARLFVETVAFGPGAWENLPLQLKETFVRNALTHLDEMNDPTALRVDLQALTKFRRSTLITNGEKSPQLFKPVIRKLSRAIPGSKVLIYAGAGHAPHVSHSREFVETVTSFAKSSNYISE